MVTSLEDLRKEYEAVKYSSMDEERKTLRYSNIMTRLEREYQISIFGRNDDNPALPLYKEIAQARTI